MKLALVNTDIFWESANENLLNCDRIISELVHNINYTVDIVVFPEFFTTGFSMNPEIAQQMSGDVLHWMKRKSKESKIAILSSVPIKEGDNIYNRALFVTPHGDVYHYDKRHLFRFSSEDKVYTAGKAQLIIPYKGVNIAVQICYDLRFPVWSRNIDLSYDIMINVANWPSQRGSVIEPLVRARAIENLSFFAFVNRKGEDPYCAYDGECYAFDFKGDPIIPSDQNIDFKIIDIDLASLKLHRERFKAWLDADLFKIIL